MSAPGAIEPELGQERVLDTGLGRAAELVVVLDPVPLRKAAKVADELGAPHVLGGDEVIGHEDDALRIEHARRADPLERPHGERAGDVVHHHEIARHRRERSGLCVARPVTCEDLRRQACGA